MLFMVIENFKEGPHPVGERFALKGRMMPDDLVYQASWIDANGTRCFQLMEAPSAEAFQAWMDRWKDIVDFEVVPLVGSKEFWANLPPVG